jgi:hypothetical protein
MASMPPSGGSGTSNTAGYVQGGGSIVKGLGGFQAGKANAKMARAEAKGKLRAGVAQDDDIRRDARRAAGEAVAAMGANGASLGTGSALDVLRDIEVESGIDRLRVKAGARNEAEALNAQARLYKRQGAWALVSGVFDAAAAAAGGGGGG